MFTVNRQTNRIALVSIRSNPGNSQRQAANAVVLAALNYDSLKLKHMFELMGHGEWQEEQIRQHQSAMIDVFSKHYN